MILKNGSFYDRDMQMHLKWFSRLSYVSVYFLPPYINTENLLSSFLNMVRKENRNNEGTKGKQVYLLSLYIFLE